MRKKLAWLCMLVSLELGRVRQEDPWGSWSASWAKLVSSRFGERDPDTKT